MPGQEVGPDGKVLYTCAPPAAVAAAIRSQPLPIVLGELSRLWKKEVDLRFQGLHWDDQCRAPAVAASSPQQPPVQQQDVRSKATHWYDFLLNR